MKTAIADWLKSFRKGKLMVNGSMVVDIIWNEARADKIQVLSPHFRWLSPAIKIRRHPNISSFRCTDDIDTVPCHLNWQYVYFSEFCLEQRNLLALASIGKVSCSIMIRQ